MSGSLLPPYTTPLEQALERTTARLGEVPHPLELIWDPASCPKAFLPWLAWGLSADDWDSAWPEDVQRRVVAATLLVHRYKGTPGAVRLALEALGFRDIHLIEWWQDAPQGAPWTFRIEIRRPEGLSEPLWQAALQAIWNAKNLRSHLGSLRFDSTLEQNRPVLAPALTLGHRSRLRPPVATHTRQERDHTLVPVPRTLVGTGLWPRRDTALAPVLRSGETVRLRPPVVTHTRQERDHAPAPIARTLIGTGLWPRRDTALAIAPRCGLSARLAPRRRSANALAVRSGTVVRLYPSCASCGGLRSPALPIPTLRALLTSTLYPRSLS